MADHDYGRPGLAVDNPIETVGSGTSLRFVSSQPCQQSRHASGFRLGPCPNKLGRAEGRQEGGGC